MNECNGERSSLVKRLDNSKDRDDNIHRGISIVPQLVQLRHGLFDIALLAIPYEVLNDQRMRLIAYLEDVITVYESETRMSGLKIIDGLSHIAFTCEDQSLQSIFVVLNLIKAIRNRTSEAYGISYAKRLDKREEAGPFPFHTAQEDVSSLVSPLI
jgi:hypothetical protein